MDFRTIVDIKKYNEKIDYSKKMMFIGSCFTENIGQKFKDYFFDVDINPFGVIYNPASVLSSLEFLVERKVFLPEDLFFDNDIWRSYSHHGSFSDSQQKVVLNNINERIKLSSEFLQTADYLFVTFGTAWVYRLCETKKVVANCHKQAASKFERLRLSVDFIVEKYVEFLQKLKTFNPQIKVIFTVSPVRHWKDGATENQVSKSTLILSINKIVEELDFVSYFPSYEIVMDELRDYRFYANDMVHISNVAVDYIWQRIGDSLLTDRTLNELGRVEKIKKAISHRVLNESSKEYVLFLEKTMRKIEDLQKENKYIKLEEAMNRVKIKLTHYL